ncbi:NAD(P)H-dependent oxidoreductase [Neptuniibacter sp.]|uniref:NAD(P)H-dependent oxidoreductase n=1 Tax=Neptuniibacter sp. TaxID=1962643 RepID=UPI002612E15C|nr:NAD(P)H-dependent oxidoreductase [Neptuniibacter sp.]MCP4596785.1 NAD(P)H-dependent oxidoreductase [Neptuniibacter sp.]
MKKIFIINAHQYHPYSEGELNQALVNQFKDFFNSSHYEVRTCIVDQGYEVKQQLAHFLWADLIIVQTPVYWMSVPWLFKKYIDEVFMEGVTGIMCDGDGRHESDPKTGYGTGGVLTDKKYLLSLTFNAPEEAFNDPQEPFFSGRSVDDLFWPVHLTFQFCGMKPLDTFTCYDVKKNPEIEQDFERLAAHLDKEVGKLRG